MFEGETGKRIMIQQGYVPQTCTLPVDIAGPLIWDEINKGRSPCDGCYANRNICNGGLQKIVTSQDKNYIS
jgi:hypothetical protein